MLLITSGLCYGQNATRLIKEFKKESNAEYVCIPKILMLMGAAFNDDAGLTKNANSLRVLDLEGCPDDVRKRFTERLNDIKGYDTLMKVKDDGDEVRILAKIKGDRIKEFFIVTAGEDCSAVLFKGSFSKEDIAKIIND